MHHKWIRVIWALAFLGLSFAGFAAVALAEHEWIAPLLLLVFVFVAMPNLLIVTARALGSSLREPEPLPALVEFADSLTFSFDHRVGDRLDCYEAQHRRRGGNRRWIRWSAVALGLLFLCGVLMSWDDPSVKTYQRAAWFIMGCVGLGPGLTSLWYRVRIWRDEPRVVKTEVRFDEGGIHVKSGEAAENCAFWHDAVEFIENRKGLALTFLFHEGVWLPNRLFHSGVERGELIETLAEWHDKNLTRRCLEQERNERFWGMREDVFWELIDLLANGHELDEPEILEPIVNKLSTMTVEEIKGFEDILAEQLYRLDTQAHKQGMLKGDDLEAAQEHSREEFLYARCLVVARGLYSMRALLAHPSEMPYEEGFPAILEVARLAWEKKCAEPFLFRPMKGISMGCNLDGWPAGSVEEELRV